MASAFPTVPRKCWRIPLPLENLALVDIGSLFRWAREVVFKLLIHRPAASILPVEKHRCSEVLFRRLGCSSGIWVFKISWVCNLSPSPWSPDNSLDLLLHNLFPLLRMGEELTVGWKEVWSFRDRHFLGPSDFSGCRKVGVGRGQVTIRNHYYVNITGKLPSVSSVTQSWLTFCDPMDCSTPDFPVHHELPELAQTHIHWVGDALQSSHPLSSPSPPAFNLSQYQGLFKWVSSSHQVAKVLELQLKYQYFQWIFRTGLL